ncbi:MAG TPA: immune inhibitor A domain-containing protein, partial [Actinomycetota bacterium]|nr:immune inhibitor A domain-containing protein [Actinomycetota bacterium]
MTALVALVGVSLGTTAALEFTRPAAVKVSGSGDVTLENSFVSSRGWVKPGERYPFRIIVTSSRSTPVSGAQVTVGRVDGTTFLSASSADDAGRAVIRGGNIHWMVGELPAASEKKPVTRTLVVVARSDPLWQDPQIVWKNLSSEAELSYTDKSGSHSVRATSHGPKVIPPDPRFESARYGDRPFPVVPVDYSDREHSPDRSGERLEEVLNSPTYPGSTFNLYQEMSYGQLWPQGTVPSAGIETADFNVEWKSERYKERGFQFTTPQPQGSCRGITRRDLVGTPLYSERIRDGWYQLPGSTDYYGDDRYGTALIGALGGIGSLQAIDDACGPAGKAVYDAAHIADPEIDYSDYDTDKDGVVDFFMLIFVGRGGHGVSQTSVPPYDNIWPHSSSLENAYVDPESGLRGYVSDDHLKDLRGRKLYYSNETRERMTTRVTKFPVYVRVGPYNVNPETAIDRASVISHEYGHSLGLPDFYSTGTRETYGHWNLMATDYSQHMDVFAKQKLGWLVPRVLNEGTHVIRKWRDSKRNTHRIDWVTPGGRPYRLTGPGVNNGEAYVAKLPARPAIDPEKVREGASPEHVWWSGSGRNFGCPPTAGHNLDIYLPELEELAPGTPITVTFKSYWEIKWDDDYGFVMYTTDRGQTYHSVPSQNRYTTPAAVNPQNDPCQALYGNGLTGTSGSYQAGTAPVDRAANAYPDGPFLQDSYDLSEAAGQDTVLRFSYTTDGGSTKPGWFIDDIEVTADGEVIYKSNFEKAQDTRIYNGACKEDLTTGQKCTEGWGYISSSEDSPADHAYYMEMRDRSGFDASGKAQSDRGAINFLPGLLLVYTDENHGLGNVGVDNPPPQSPLDSQPEPGNSAPNLHDAAWTDADGDNAFSDFGEGHTDNYTDPRNADPDGAPDNFWHFIWQCLSFKILSMEGHDVGPETLPGNLIAKVRIT